MRRGISVLRAVLLGSTLSTAQQLCAQSTPSSFTTGYRYDIGGRLVGEIKPDPDGSTGPLHYPATRYTYSASGLLTKVEKGELATWQSEAVAPANWTGFTIFTAEKHSYSPFGQVAATAVSAGGTTYSVTQQNYDSFLYPKCTAVRMNQGAFPTIPANEFQALPTDACSLGTQGSDGPDRIMKTTYDTLGRLQTIQKALGVTTANGFPSTLQQTYASYTYTPSFKIDTITDANGNVAKFTYDGLDRQQCWIFPSKTTGQVSGDCVSAGSAGGDYEKYAYDTAGNRTSFTRRDGRIIRYTYDALGRLASKCVTATTACVVPNATTGRDVYYGYDLLGRMTAAKFDSSSGADGIGNSFDGFGNLTSTTTAMAGFSKTLGSQYDADNNRTQITHPDNQLFTYGYDGLDRLSGIYEGAGTGTPLDTLTFNPDETLLKRTEGPVATPTATVDYTWDGMGRLKTQSDTFSSAPTSNVSWNLSPIDAPINAASQITKEVRDNDSYAYGGLVAVNRPYATNKINQYTSAGSATFSYDLNGNLTSDGTNTYTYDAENRLVQVTAGGANTTVTYDPLGRLFQVVKGTANTRFLYDGNALVAEYDSSGNLANRYVHGSDSAADDPLIWYVGATLAARRYLHADHLDSIVAITNCNAGNPCINKYDDYGIPPTDTSNNNLNTGRFQFTGQAFLPELGAGMYYYKARMYSAFLGRFLQTDPIGYDDQLNLYEYVGDDPLNENDPSGECPACVGAVVGGIGGFLVEAVDEASSGHFSAAGLTSATLGGAATGAVFASTGSPTLAGAAGGFVQNSSRALMEGKGVRSATVSGLKGAVIGGVVGRFGGRLAANGPGRIGSFVRSSRLGRAAANNEKFANMTFGRLKAGQISSRSIVGKTGGRLVIAATTSSAASAVVQSKAEQASRSGCPANAPKTSYRCN